MMTPFQPFFNIKFGFFFHFWGTVLFESYFFSLTWTLKVTLRSMSMLLVPSAFAGSWGISLEWLRTRDYIMKLSQGLLPAESMNTNSGYMSTWHSSQSSILLIGLFLHETTLSGGDQVELMDGKSQLILPGGTWDWQGSCIGACSGGPLEVEAVDEATCPWTCAPH